MVNHIYNFIQREFLFFSRSSCFVVIYTPQRRATTRKIVLCVWEELAEGDNTFDLRHCALVIHRKANSSHSTDTKTHPDALLISPIVANRTKITQLQSFFTAILDLSRENDIFLVTTPYAHTIDSQICIHLTPLWTQTDGSVIAIDTLSLINHNNHARETFQLFGLAGEVTEQSG